ncbi:head maturation protease, ClpP-related [Amantichitinum ursilacus]|uniref:ATP-dependent Clp protease proteolytic subunit 1 n=1 Tax=Amantichitinum ursilacus TaxID=857265 RepID=A0A0N1JST2_9NEIS|nr:head maturation protease, ClpP-related [Amantichitinum ursilacus]KPC53019.1 ATP-dependent Clp protease proteolytic subunit 1 [Amantichitinum ursilacus]
MHQLMRLMALNKSSARRFEVVASAADEATIYLYDVIVANQTEADWYGGVAADSFVKSLQGITASTIHLRINSPGGDVFGARAMEQALRDHPARVVSHIDGVAASAASFLSLAADEIEITPGGFFMIHKAWTMAYGNSDDLTRTAAVLEQVDESLVGSYVAATGQSADDIRAWMADETWIGAEEAVNLGFATRVAGQAPANTGQWDLSAYNKTPAPLAKSAAPPRPADLAESVRAVLAEMGIAPPAASVQPDPGEAERAHRQRLLALQQRI